MGLLLSRGPIVAPYEPLFRDNFAGHVLQSLDYSAGILAAPFRDGEVRGLFSNQYPSGRELMDAKMGLVLSAAPVSRLSGAGSAAREGAAVSWGTKVYRVYGGQAKASGRSWTTVDPRTVPGYRDLAGLPNQNTGRFLIEGTIMDTRGIILKTADPLHGNRGGLPEVIVPHPALDLLLDQSSLLTPGL